MAENLFNFKPFYRLFLGFSLILTFFVLNPLATANMGQKV